MDSSESIRSHLVYKLTNQSKISMIKHEDQSSIQIEPVMEVDKKQELIELVYLLKKQNRKF